ncbi:hypothetical protein BH11PSE11_BH11PSE11_17770 [soil metagenome]
MIDAGPCAQSAHLTQLLALLIATSSHNALGAPIIGNGEVVSQSRPSGRITAIRAYKMWEVLKSDCNMLTVNILATPISSVVVEAERNIVRYVQTEVLDETLVISLSADIQPTRQIVVSAPYLNSEPSTAKANAPLMTIKTMGCASDFTWQLPNHRKAVDE